MKKTGFFILVLVFTTLLGYSKAIAASQTYYVTYSGAGSQDGRSISDAWSWSDFLSSGNWSATEDNAKIDPGDTVYLSGAFSIGSNTNYIPGGGSSGNYVVIDGDDGVNPPATLTSSYGGSYRAAFNSNGKNYLEFRDLNLQGTQYTGFRLDSSSYVKIHNFTLNGAYDQGVSADYCDHIEIYDSSFTCTKSHEVSGSADGIRYDGTNNSKIYRNIVSDWGHTAISVYRGYNNSTASYEVDIYENHINLPTRGYGRAFDLESSGASHLVYNVYIHHNFIDTMRAKSQIDQADHIYVYNNIFYNALNCCESDTDAGCHEGYWNCDTKLYRKTGQHWEISTNYGESSYLYFYNNTFYKSVENAISLHDAYANLYNIHFKNNIFYDAANACTPSDDPVGSTGTAFDRSLYNYNDETYSTTMAWTNNIIYSPGRSDAIYWDGTYYTVAEFDAAFAWASNNIQLDPKLVNPSNHDFSLQITSPAINAGTNLGSDYDDAFSPATSLPPNSTTMLDQDSYDAGWEIGAFVYCGTLCNSTNTAPQPPQGLKIDQPEP